MDFTQFGGDRENKLKLFHSTRGLFAALLQFPKPIVGAVRGAAVGGGFTLALCCDIRIASEDAYFGFLEVKLGIPAPYEVVRVYANESKAREWCQTGRRIEAREAQDEGIVRKVVKAERLLDECQLEAEGMREKNVPAALSSALELQMARFARALFPGGMDHVGS
jgi:enoyl-CoA hydratase/carnithine racemase